MNKPLILAVEDDTAVRNLITTTLETQDLPFPYGGQRCSGNFGSSVSETGYHASGSGASGHGWSGSDQKNPFLVKSADYSDQCAE